MQGCGLCHVATWQHLTKNSMKLIRLLFLPLLFVLAACASAPEPEPTAVPEPTQAPTDIPEPTDPPEPTAEPEPTEAEAMEADSADHNADDDSMAEDDAAMADDSSETAALSREDCAPTTGRIITRYWEKTNWCESSVDFSEFLSGGPPPDGIPPIDDPKFVTTTEANSWIAPNEPVISLTVNGETRAYPLQIMTWHEIVNDEVGGVPVTVTFCPLCNSAITFDRRVDGEVLDFGTSGNLRNSDLVMYDRQTESWWQQFTGEALVGDYNGAVLTFVPSQLVGWEEFRTTFPNAQVLSRDTGAVRDYGRNPYAGYDDINASPFLFDGAVDGRLPAMARVATVDLDGETVAYTFDALEANNAINDSIATTDVVVFWTANTNSALGAGQIAEAADVGSTAIFDRSVADQVLTFTANGDGTFSDAETSSTWNVFGLATDGELAGTQLDQIVSFEHFWFSWAVFQPDTRVFEG